MRERNFMRLLRFLRTGFAVVLLPTLLLPLGGCWDRLEIEKRAVVLGIAVDSATAKEAGDDNKVTHLGRELPKVETHKLRITAQIAIPGRIPLGPGEGGSGGGKPKPVWVVSAYGHTIDDAMMVLQQKLSDRIFLGHLRVIVVAEDVARAGMSNINDYFRRNPQVRRLAWMIVAKDEAASLMAANPELKRVPALYILAMMDHAVEMGKYPDEFVGKFWSKRSSKGRDPHLPYVQMEAGETFSLKGMALFDGDRMVDYTDPLQIGVFMAMTNIQSGGYSVYTPRENLMYRATYRSAKTRLKIENGHPHFRIDIQVEGNIEEKPNESYDLETAAQLAALEKRLGAAAQKGALALIALTQEANADIFGFGELVRAKKPAFWNREIRTKDNWHRMYKKSTFEVNYVIKIRRVGMKAE
ncbi:Ger(x)C family spore germination protein [Paenibacillus sp. IB182496]|uniref:Ger(X)C family spore germination protein n=1 Tax=Paenibacillus sabuli TaxID=2772509 RepID=A0A927BW73_9BACL|nr:Ger(x)C family spore germination protein [Paenibacillus sabuli]MBD2846775.1 Ger(x)C family spore germination protein [Paenibacillus sabuli]